MNLYSMQPLVSFTPHIAGKLLDHGHKIVVTGATGWLGQTTLEMLVAAFGRDFGNRVIAIGSHEHVLTLSNGVRVQVIALEAARGAGVGESAILFHYAFLTKDKVPNHSAKDYSALNRKISETVRSWIEEGRIRGVMMPSSGAIYDCLHGDRRDSHAVPYGCLKLEDEETFSKSCRSVASRLAMPRVFNLSGPYINKFETYALSSIIVDVLHGGPIRLRADHLVLRSYVYVGDVIEICVRWLLQENDQLKIIFDTVGQEVVEVGDLARRVAIVLSGNALKMERPAITESRVDRYVGDDAEQQALCETLGYKFIGLDDQIRRTALYIRRCLQS